MAMASDREWNEKMQGVEDDGVLEMRGWYLN